MSKLHEEMKEWRHYIHNHPETAFEEKNTASFVAEKLKEWGYEVFEGIGKTGVVGRLKVGDGKKTIGLRADMDANPIVEKNDIEYKSVNEGKMHACGHDGHTTQLLGAAKLIAKNKNFNGTVVLVFQPAEEPGKGAKAMIAEGLFEKFPIDEFYGLHNMPSIYQGMICTRSGGIMGSEDDFIISIHGKGGHASSPHLGKDPLVIASEIILALQTIASRNANPLHNIVVSCTELFTDGAVNAIPSNVTIKGDTRSTTKEDQELIENHMRKIVKGICEANDAEWEFSYSYEFSPTVNTKECSEVVVEAATKLFGKERVNADCEPWMASEDFGTFLNKVKGCFFFLGSGKNPVSTENTPLHNANFNYNDDILEDGARLFAEIVESRLK